MFKFKDGKPDEVISARNIKYCESKSCKTKTAITNGKGAVFSRKCATCAPICFEPTQSANDISF